jgi:hypothetical protein
MEGVPVDLDRQHDGNPGQIQAVLAVVARGVLDGREFETEADDKPSDVGFKDAGRRGADEAPVDQMAPEGPDAGAPGTGQTIDLGLEAGDGDQSPGDGVVDGLGEILGQRGARQIDERPQRVGDDEAVAVGRLRHHEVRRPVTDEPMLAAGGA